MDENTRTSTGRRSWKDVALVRDLLDRRGIVDGSDRALTDSIVVLGPTIIGSLLPFLEPVTNLLAALPNGIRIVSVVVPLLLLVMVIFIICAQHPTPRDPVGFSPAHGRIYSYRFTREMRQAAKWTVLPLVFLSAYQVYAAAPNAAFLRSRMAGYICTDSGAPITQGSLTAHDAFGGVSSNIPGQLDDVGYFVIELNPMSATPTELHFTGWSMRRSQDASKTRSIDLEQMRDK